MSLKPSDDEDKIAFRDFIHNDDDLNFIISNWVHSYRENSPIARNVREDIYRRNQRELILNLCRRPSIRVVISCFESDPNVMLGFLVYEIIPDPPGKRQNTIHYIYVKKPFRRNGIARDMLQCVGVVPEKSFFSHYTVDCPVFARKWNGLLYNPYSLIGELNGLNSRRAEKTSAPPDARRVASG
jgi:hypothetical protein